MARQSYANLKDLRERLLGYRRDAVARLGGIPEARLAAIEEGDAPSVHETESLARLYGVAAEILAEEPIVLQAGDGIEALALMDEFRVISDVTKAEVVAAANAARDLVLLRRQAGEEDPRRSFAADMRAIPPPPSGTLPFAAGRHYAERVRRQFRMGAGSIPSLRDWVARAFPSVSVLYANLGTEGVAGLTFADVVRGPTVVLNLEGKNENPCVRRFSLAHELCHLLVDWNRQEPLATLSGFLGDVGRDREQRANAFAARLLCPESVVRRLATTHQAAPLRAAEDLMDGYGLHYDAARLYLGNVAGVELPVRPPAGLLGSRSPLWAPAEAPLDVASFPLGAVPPERRTLVARYAARLHSEGKLSRDRLAESLGVTPAQDLERVLDFFALDPQPPRM
jgi:Zn-dependent peptidase ImmA (M78 family)